MAFSIFYLAFVIVSSIYRFKRLSKSYQHPVGRQGTVSAPISYAILITLYLTIWLASILEYLLLRSMGGINLYISGLGVIMYAAVIPLRARAIDSLGKNMSPEIEIKKDHRLIKEGPYRYLRHPLALCILVELAGFTLVSNSYNAFWGVLAIFFPFTLIRIHLEEKALIEKFGEEYLEYKKEVSALLPLIKRKPSP